MVDAGPFSAVSLKLLALSFRAGSGKLRTERRRRGRRRRFRRGVASRVEWLGSGSCLWAPQGPTQGARRGSCEESGGPSEAGGAAGVCVGPGGGAGPWPSPGTPGGARSGRAGGRATPGRAGLPRASERRPSGVAGGCCQEEAAHLVTEALGHRLKPSPCFVLSRPRSPRAVPGRCWVLGALLRG